MCVGGGGTKTHTIVAKVSISWLEVTILPMGNAKRKKGRGSSELGTHHCGEGVHELLGGDDLAHGESKEKQGERESSELGTHHCGEGVHELLGGDDLAHGECDEADTAVVHEVHKHVIAGPALQHLATANTGVLTNQNLGCGRECVRACVCVRARVCVRALKCVMCE